jgi:hypothetical protein
MSEAALGEAAMQDLLSHAPPWAPGSAFSVPVPPIGQLEAASLQAAEGGAGVEEGGPRDLGMGNYLQPEMEVNAAPYCPAGRPCMPIPLGSGWPAAAQCTHLEGLAVHRVQVLGPIALAAMGSRNTTPDPTASQVSAGELQPSVFTVPEAQRRSLGF